MIVVVINAQIVGDPSFAVNPPHAGIQSLGAVAACQRRKRIDNAARASRPVHTKIDIVLRTPPASAPSARSPVRSDKKCAASGAARPATRAEIMDQPEHHGIRTVIR